MIILETRSEVKFTVTPKWYSKLRHPKMHPHTKFGIFYLKYYRRYASDTMLRTDSPFVVIKILSANTIRFSTVWIQVRLNIFSGLRSGPTSCQAWSGFKLFAKVISRQRMNVCIALLWFNIFVYSLITFLLECASG